MLRMHGVFQMKTIACIILQRVVKRGLDALKVVGKFPAAAKTGDRDKAPDLLLNLNPACVGCHFSYRT